MSRTEVRRPGLPSRYVQLEVSSGASKEGAWATGYGGVLSKMGSYDSGVYIWDTPPVVHTLGCRPACLACRIGDQLDPSFQDIRHSRDFPRACQHVEA